MDNISRNQGVLGCSEISTNVIFKHVEHVRIIWTEKLPGAETFKYKNVISFSVKNLMISFSMHGGTVKKNARLWFATWVRAQPDNMPNVTI